MKRSGRVARTALAVVTVLLAGVALNGHSAEPTEELTVLGPWTDDEEVAFRAVLEKFRKSSGIHARYQGHRDVSQVLQVAIERDRPPDVAVLPRVNDLQRYVNAGRLVPLEGPITTDPGAAPQLVKLAPKVGEVRDKLPYAVSVTTHLKSVVWYAPTELKRFGQSAPSTWDELVGLTQRRIGAEQVRWCLGMSAQSVSGWPGTDWIEDILLHRSGEDSYEKWTRGDLHWNSPEVKGAWETWGALLGVSSEQTARASLYTTFQTAAKGLFPREVEKGDGEKVVIPPRCHLDHQGSFVVRKYPRKPSTPTNADPPFTFFSTPPIGPKATQSLHEVSDDVAVMFRHTRDSKDVKDSDNTERARELMSYLASEQAQTAWREPTEGVAFSRRGDAPEPQDRVLAAVAEQLRTGTLCWDASDLMPAAMATAFERAILVYLEAPERLDSLLAELEKLRDKGPKAEWLDLTCVSPRERGPER
ncbi:extracellular solute-binding protein [Micromonospora sp. NPDC049171]|uniref:ABC transporter substrate-binding protein n=1 Tax=Micromonospora sp. NPDC049171 TaxID=3155770 RepID=UPI0033FABA0F